MNAEGLLAHYERIADAPYAVGRLRRFILDLAVLGKLVPQDPVDEPASELLKRVAEEQQRLGISNRRRGPARSSEPLLNEAELPEGWTAVRGCEIFPARSGNSKLIKGTLHSTPGAGLFPGYSAAGQDVWLDGWEHEGDAIIVSAVGARCGKAFLATGKWSAVANTQIVWLLRPVTFPAFAMLHLNNEAFWVRSGGAQPFIKVKETLERGFRLPPLAEQHRIVAKVNELMGLCDRLETGRSAREAARDLLSAASLARLNAPDPATFQADARFVLDALPSLTTRADQIKAMRQTIRDLAVRGKLVPQHVDDEPASELLKRVAREKARRNTRETDEAEIDNAAELGELPLSWRAVPLIALGSWAIGSGFPKNEQGLESGPHFFLKVSDMNLPGNEKYITTSNNCIDDEAARRMRAKIHPPGTIIFPKIGGAIATNKRRILTVGSAIDNNCLGITISTALNVEWAFLLLTTIDLTRYQVGTAVPALQQGVLEKIPVGLPPLAEQHRIVAKVDELMALCDQLEASLITTAATRRRLLDALLRAALDDAPLAETA